MSIEEAQDFAALRAHDGLNFATANNMKSATERDQSSTNPPFLVPGIRPDRMGSSVSNVGPRLQMPAASDVEKYCWMRAHRRRLANIESLRIDAHLLSPRFR